MAANTEARYVGEVHDAYLRLTVLTDPSELSRLGPDRVDRGRGQLRPHALVMRIEVTVDGPLREHREPAREQQLSGEVAQRLQRRPGHRGRMA